LVLLEKPDCSALVLDDDCRMPLGPTRRDRCESRANLTPERRREHGAKTLADHDEPVASRGPGRPRTTTEDRSFAKRRTAYVLREEGQKRRGYIEGAGGPVTFCNLFGAAMDAPRG